MVEAGLISIDEALEKFEGKKEASSKKIVLSEIG